jgi:hypothetical protein
MSTPSTSSHRKGEIAMAAIANGSLAERLLEEINAKEDLSLRLGDALDVKASIGLALILFLATQSAYFIDKGLSHVGLWMQIASIGFVAFATFFALRELWPRTYILPEPEAIPKRVEQLQQHFQSHADAYPDVAGNVAEALLNEEIRCATKRIAANQKKNWIKSHSLNRSFWFTVPAIILNIATVLTLIKY